VIGRVKLPLQGIRVLELAQVMAGPFCCQLLADFGADVIKVEPPDVGDQTRRSMGPTVEGGDTGAFLAVNRNKRSITLNLKHREGQEVFYRLVETADVLVENFRPGTTAKLGVDYPRLRELNPRLIYASISGFGQTGPYADRPGLDLIVQGMSGIMSVTGEPDGPPVKAGIPVSDLAAGLFTALAILVAIQARRETGSGQRIDASLFDSALALSIWETSELWTTGRVPRRHGSAHRLLAPYQALRTADGYVTVGVANQRMWASFCAAVGRPDLADDPRFRENADRLAHQEELRQELEKAMADRTTEEHVEILLSRGVPAGPLKDYVEVLGDPHTLARDMVVELDHAAAGRTRTLGIPVKLSETPGAIRTAAPTLGAHTEEVLRDLGLSTSDIGGLRARGAL
jgi:crotonobetainyl-CoA:carnitine CoA-transferase CaiB-like acyl-CoA transferase